MGLYQSLLMLLPLCWTILSPMLQAQSSGPSQSSARSLDGILQDYAYRAFVRPKTGTPYDGKVPSNLAGISISAMRLKCGSLRTRGVSSYKEFEIPVGVIVQPYVERLVLVYQNLGNWSQVYYPLPGYTYVAPVVGLLAYDASNLSAVNLPLLDVQASGKPILIKFANVKPIPDGSVAKCVTFGLQGLPNISNAIADNVCSTVEQGHFAIVTESIAPVPGPSVPPPTGGGAGNGGGGKKKSNSKMWKILGSVLGGLVVLVLLVLLIMWVKKYRENKNMRQMETAADVGEALRVAPVGNTRAPVAMGTRTQPTIEHDYVP